MRESSGVGRYAMSAQSSQPAWLSTPSELRLPIPKRGTPI